MSKQKSVDAKAVEIATHLPPGTAITIPSLLTAGLPDSIPRLLAVTLCKSPPGIKRRIGDRVKVDAQVAGIREDLGDKGVGIVVRITRMESEYRVDFFNPVPEFYPDGHSPLELLCQQGRAQFFGFDRPGAQPVRKICCENEPAAWRKVRDTIRPWAGTRDEFLAACRVFRSKSPDLKKTMKEFRRESAGGDR